VKPLTSAATERTRRRETIVEPRMKLETRLANPERSKKMEETKRETVGQEVQTKRYGQ